MISIIMTYYNTPFEQIKMSIESVLNQRYRGFEFILVDDCSEYDDELHKLIEQNKNIKLIRNEINLGHSKSRNIGIDNSNGEYLFFIDSDDYIYPYALGTLYDNLLNNNTDISIGNFSHVMQPNNPNKVRVYNKWQALNIICCYDEPYVLRTIPQVQFNATWNKIYKRELFNNIRFPKGYVHDDTFTMHKIFYNAEKIVFTNCYTYMYRLNGNIAGKYKRDMLLAHKDRLEFVKSLNNKSLIINEQKWYDKVLKEYNNDIVL